MSEQQFVARLKRGTCLIIHSLRGLCKRCVPLFLCLLLLSALALAGDSLLSGHFTFGPETAVGTIQALSRNTIELYDEDRREVRRFVYLGDLGEIREGDRVRVYYSESSGRVELIKKMTALEYQKAGQNLGYVVRKEK